MEWLKKAGYDEADYRQWLGEKIEGMTGRLDGEHKGLWSLNTESLEKLFKAIIKKDPAVEYKVYVARR